MREGVGQFKKFSTPESYPKNVSAYPEAQALSEKKGSFAEAVECIKTNERGVKLLTLLMDPGHLLSQEELQSTDVQRLVAELRRRYPTIEDVQNDLEKAVDEQVGVAPQEGCTKEQYEQAIQAKRLQYKNEAVRGIVVALGSVYEKFGAVPSEENKKRIIENLTVAVEEMDPHNISPLQLKYVKKNVMAAVKQNISPDEARRILQAQRVFFEVWRQMFPGRQSDSELETAIQRIKEKSGLVSDETKEQLEVTDKEILTERFELRQKKKEVDYPGVPIDIYLSDKHLQIIDVRDDGRWGVDYLLIDPVTFGHLNPVTGYKGIRDNEPFILGRQNPLRFDLPDTVSNAHLKVGLKGGKLSIEDLGSTNGTVIQLEKPRRLSKEQVEGEGVSSEKEHAIAGFHEYIKKHQSEIEKEFQQGRDLGELFYHDFYSKNVDELKYHPEDHWVQKLEQEYSVAVDAIKEKLTQEAEKGSGLVSMDNGYWLYCNVNGGVRNQKELGRFYFNLKPEHVAKFFAQTTETFRYRGLQSQMKIPMHGDAEAFNRFDKMVIYFDATQEQKVLQVLEDLYHANPEFFDETGTPRFTAGVKDKEGKNMVGIGFAEEPVFRNKSFGEIRASILVEVYRDARFSGLYVSDPRFDFESSFRKACMKYQVDPQNPAFNLSQGTGKFTELKRRTKGDIRA